MTTAFKYHFPLEIITYHLKALHSKWLNDLFGFKIKKSRISSSVCAHTSIKISLHNIQPSTLEKHNKAIIPQIRNQHQVSDLKDSAKIGA